MGYTVGELKGKILNKLFELVDKASVADIPVLAAIYEKLPDDAVPIAATETVELDTAPETVEE